jgi:hypothetical protein
MSAGKDNDNQSFPLGGLITANASILVLATVAPNTYRRGKTWRASMSSRADYLVETGWKAAFMAPPGMATTDRKPLCIQASLHIIYGAKVRYGQGEGSLSRNSTVK